MCSLPPKYVWTCPGKIAFSEMYVCREYSLSGRRSSHAMPIRIRRALRYGGSLRRMGDLRSVRRRAAVIICVSYINTSAAALDLQSAILVLYHEDVVVKDIDGRDHEALINHVAGRQPQSQSRVTEVIGCRGLDVSCKCRMLTFFTPYSL